MALPVNGSTRLIPALLRICRPRKDECISIYEERSCVVQRRDLHEVLHDVRLVAFERQTEVGNLDDVVEKVEELGNVFEVERGKVDDGLDLLRKDFQARHLVPDKRLTNAAQTNQAKMFLVSYNTMMILYWETQFNLFYFLCMFYYATMAARHTVQ